MEDYQPGVYFNEDMSAKFMVVTNTEFACMDETTLKHFQFDKTQTAVSGVRILYPKAAD